MFLHSLCQSFLKSNSAFFFCIFGVKSPVERTECGRSTGEPLAAGAVAFHCRLVAALCKNGSFYTSQHKDE